MTITVKTGAQTLALEAATGENLGDVLRRAAGGREQKTEEQAGQPAGRQAMKWAMAFCESERSLHKA